MINIIIDELTNCLEVRKTGEIVETYYKKRRKKFTDKEIAKMREDGWSNNFNWKAVQDDGYQVYELRTKTDLIEHYMQTLSAIIVNPRIPVKLLLNTRAASKLIKKYFFAEEENSEDDK